MATHDYVIANGTGAAVRSDLNGALAAIVSQNSSATEPSPSYAYQPWADTTAGVMKMRNGANNAWITLYQLDGEWSTIAFENGTAAAPSIYFKDSGTDTGIYSPGADQVAISTGGTARITVDGSGNVNIDSNTLYVDAANNRVGIGSSAPAASLDISPSAADTIYLSSPIVAGAVSRNIALVTTGLGKDSSIDFSYIDRVNNFASTLTFRTTLDNANRNVARMTITQGGLVGIGTAASNANGGILQLSGGITFPATAVAATDPNTLDDYEEGTFTPTIYGTSTAGTTTYFQQYGLYTKIGRVVTVQVFITITNQTGTGNLQLGGLPFTAGSGANTFPCAVKTTDLALTALYYPVFSVAGGTTYINMEQTPVGGGIIYSIAIDTAFNVELTATYFV